MSPETSGKTLFLLDAYALIFRAYYAFINSRMSNSKGINTSAIYGFTVAMEDVIRTMKPSHMAVVFDPPGGSFRNQMFPDYKANRDETPEAVKDAVPWIKNIIAAWNIPVIEVPGYEADDVIGTLARQAQETGFTTYMMTPDKDFTQLVTDRILIYKPGRSGNNAEILGVKEVKERFGIENPHQVIDILALWGDSADNVPGAPGIGEKGSMKLISEFGSVDKLYENINQLKDKTRNILLENKDLIALSRKLVTIDQHVPVKLNEPALLLSDYDPQNVVGLYAELEFRSLVNRMLKSAPGIHDHQPPPIQKINPREKGNPGPVQGSLFELPLENKEVIHVEHLDTVLTIPHEYHLVNSEKEVIALAAELERQTEFCFDTETSSLNVHSTEIVGISFAWKETEAWFVYLVESPQWLQHFKRVMENPEIRKSGQNMKFDISVLRNYNIMVGGEMFDTMLAHYLIQPEEQHNMDFLARKYLHYEPIPITALIGEKGRNQRNMKQIEPQRLTEYAAEDADVTLKLKAILEPELIKFNFTSLFRDIEMPLVTVLADMECTGVTLDVPALNEYAKVLTVEILKVQEEIFRLAGTTFNIASPKQLGEILFEKLKISSENKRTKSKQYSTSEDTLSELTGKHPIVPLILDYRSFRKLLSTYVEALPELINKKTGRIHTSFNQAIVATGRLSSTNPNLQNIPVRDERGREIRKAFIPSHPEGCILSADYSQIELRLMAHMSEDPNMIEAFRNNEDIHAATASKIYGLSIAEVSREMRSKAKTANFGIIYGISGFGLSQRLGIPRKEADELIQGYFTSFPGVRSYMNKSIMNAHAKGYVETLFGRRRYLPEISSGNANIRGMAERNAINAPIQGTAADIIKIAMIRIFDAFRHMNLQSKMIMQVHDELVFDVAPGELEKIKPIVISEMENACKLQVPLIADAGTGKNWLEAH